MAFPLSRRGARTRGPRSRGGGVRTRGDRARGQQGKDSMVEAVAVESGARGSRGSRAASTSGQRPHPIDEIYIAMIEDLPMGVPLEQPLHPKRKLSWSPLEECSGIGSLATPPAPAMIEECGGIDDSPVGLKISTSPSPAVFEECGGIDSSAESSIATSPSPATIPQENVPLEPPALPGPSQRKTLAAMVKEQKVKVGTDRKNLLSLSAEARERLLALQELNTTRRFLLPNAPPGKRRRNVSPARMTCPLLPNVPEVPPPRIPQPRKQQGSSNSPVARQSPPAGPTRCPSPSPSSDDPDYYKNLDDQLGWLLPSSSAASADAAVATTSSAATADAAVATTSSAATAPSTNSTYDDLPPLLPLPAHLHTPTRKSRKLPRIFPPSSGIQRVEKIDNMTEVLGVEIEYLGFTPTSASTATPTSLSQEEEEEVNIIDEYQNRTSNWEQSIDFLNPGSDIEDIDEDVLDITTRRVNVSSSDDVLPGDVMDLLADSDRRDDAALRAMSDNLDEEILHFDWSGDPNVFTGQRETFTGPSGPTFDKEEMSPLEVFSRIWDEEIINLIVRETNTYAYQTKSAHPELKMLHTWVDVTVNDIWAFFAVIMLQSICPLPVEKDYWYPCLPYLKIGDFSKIMSFKRFNQIKKCLHFVDNTTLSVGSGESIKLKKIAPIIRHLNHKFSTLYLPEQNLAIDESLLLWKGRLSFAQLIATKAARVGIKTYELCESRTGYLWKMIVYTGKGEKQQQEQRDNEPEGATSKIVYDLIRPLLNKGHTLVMDNFYNSPLLSRTLKRQKTDTMGTLRLNREFVPDFVRNKTKSNTRVGEVVISQTHDLSVLVWHDANMVSMISSFHTPGVGGKEKHGFYKYKPQVVLDYNMSMGGVDKKDQMLQAFPLERIRNIGWYKKLFRRLLNVSVYNAFVIHNHGLNKKQRQFRVALVDEIIKKIKVQELRHARLYMMDHFPIKNQTPKARCKWCARRKVNARTSWKCNTCHTNLCHENCFQEYHTSLAEA